MKNLDINKVVDFDQELQNMIDYTLTIWDGNSEVLTTIVTDAFNAGYSAADKWINEYAFVDFAQSWSKEREKFGEKTDIMFYDDIHKIAKNILFHPSTFKQLILQDWNYEKNTRAITSSVKNKLSNVNIFPKGWQKVKDSGKSTFEYFDYVNLKEDKKFKGYNSESAGAGGFHERINLPNTFYGDAEQGRSPLYNLVSSAFAHGLTIREHNNTFELFEEIKKIKASFDKEEFNKITFIEDIQLVSDNKFFKSFMIDKYSINEKRDYNSQFELELFIKEKKENKFNYGIVQFNLMGNDDYQYNGFKIQKIYTIDHFETQIKAKVEEWFEGAQYKDIYYSDNNCTPVEIKDILSSLTFKQISQKDFEVFKKTLNVSGDSVSYGYNDSFMDYNFPNEKEMKDIHDVQIKEMMDRIKSEDTDPVEISKKEQRENAYKNAVHSIFNNKKINKNKITK